MFHIIARPPFDDYSFGLFMETFKRRTEFGLRDAEFIYTWTGFMSLDNGVIYKNIVDTLPTVDPRITVYFKYDGKCIIGDGRNFNSKEETFNRFCIKFNIVDESLRHGFYDFYDLFYSNVTDRKQAEIRVEQIINKSNKIVIFVKDHFRTQLDKSWVRDVPEISEYYSNMCDAYPNKQFIIVTSLENLHKEIIKPNCIVVNMGGDITNQYAHRHEYRPCDYKTSVNKSFISLNRGTRHHRTYLVSCLYGYGLQDNGYISYLGIDKKAPLDIDYDHTSDEQYELVVNGFNQFRMSKAVQDNYEIYMHSSGNDNITNFNKQLSPKYHTSYTELITETSYNELSFNVTEKIANSIYGKNFPLVVSSPGYVDFLRNMGIDVFDDIVNHAYDTETDKTKRIHRLINDNLELLSTNKGKLLWEQNEHRFNENIDHLQNTFYDLYTARYWNQMERIKL